MRRLKTEGFCILKVKTRALIEKTLGFLLYLKSQGKKIITSTVLKINIKKGISLFIGNSLISRYPIPFFII
jgi:hypothetical protein